MEDIGLGQYLLGLASVITITFFSLGFFLYRKFFKGGYLVAIAIGIVLGIIGFFLTPYVFNAVLDIRGISVL